MEQNKKQTAVEWLVEKINSHDSHDAVILNEKYFNESKLLKYLQVAKEMEKEQIKEAHSAGQESAYGFRDKETAGEYYQKTYEK
jgi:hypothetical protein